MEREKKSPQSQKKNWLSVLDHGTFYFPKQKKVHIQYPILLTLEPFSGVRLDPRAPKRVIFLLSVRDDIKTPGPCLIPMY